MARRYVYIWFSQLITERMIRRRPELRDSVFVSAAAQRGRMVIHAASVAAQQKGICAGMVVADCRAICPEMLVLEAAPGLSEQLLTAMAQWCIRYTPVAGIDPEEGVVLDVSGCPHLWGGERAYLEDIHRRFSVMGYTTKLAMADTIGAAAAAAKYSMQHISIIPEGKQLDAMLPLPAAALRLEPALRERLQKLGLQQISSFIHMPRRALQRRFGITLLQRLDQALGQAIEPLVPIRPVTVYQERLPSLEPIRTATGIEIALQQLLEQLCKRLEQEAKGLRECKLTCYRIDGRQQEVAIATNRPSRNTAHLLRLFETHISHIEPDLGIEVFVLEAPVVEDLAGSQEAIWQQGTTTDESAVAELLDRIAGRVGAEAIKRFLPDEHYWPERSMRVTHSLSEPASTYWRTDRPRPVQLLVKPEPIEVTVAIPDYPPVLFRHKDELHRIRKADGPERIEQEWWLQEGLYRDYYCVEDEQGRRYWVFRLGHYDRDEPQWFLHGFFA